MKRFLGVWVGLLALSCGDGVGSEDCVGAGVRCKVPEDSDDPRPEQTELSTKDLEELSPTWIHPLPIQPPEPIYGTTSLSNNLEGDVWFFTQTSKQLVASKLDADGEIAESREIDPPRGWKTVDSGFVVVSSFPQSAVGAALQVTWPVTADTSELTRVNNEWIKFGKSVDDPLQRIVPGPDSPFYTSDLIWDADGSVFALKQPNGEKDLGLGMPLSIEKFDRKLNRIWKQSALHGIYGNDANAWFGLLEGHRVAAFIEKTSTSAFHIGVLGADGNFEPWFERELQLAPRFRVAQQGPKGPVLVANNSNGDLVVATMSAKPRSLKVVTLLREDYQWLATVNAVDRLGNVYVAPVIGGRAASDQRRTICRVPVSGEPRCLLLARSAELEIAENPIYAAGADLAVHADGVVFMRAGSALVRIDFPED
jgi:hypothetical protein